MEQGHCCVKCGNFIQEKQLNSIVLSSKLTEQTNKNSLGKINVNNSNNVVIKNVTYITGPVIFNKISNNIEEQSITNELFVNKSDEQINESFDIIPREIWMAQPPRQITKLPNIAKYVIIAHTATEEGYNISQNALLVKLIQNFHVDSRGWDDIGYNFLIGCDGKVYEGRGWNIQGAHTFGYNHKSICIAFIGCFMNHLPSLFALNAAKELINRGIDLKCISENYILVGHCQCIPVESPGVQLYKEIKTWRNWRELNSDDCKFLLL